MTVRKIKSIGDIPYPIDVGTDALSPLLTAGAALGITGDEPTDSAEWLQRTSTSDGPTTAKSIHGRTLRWNQLCKVTARTATSKGITYTADASGKVTISAPSGATGMESFYTDLANVVSIVGGHKYLVCGGAAGVSLRVGGNLGGQVPKIISTATESVSNSLSFRVEETFTGTFECFPQLFDLTAMFGAGSEPSTVAEFEALYPLPYYPYDAGSLLPVNMTGIESTAADESWTQQRTIPAGTLRGAGSAYDELTETERIVRVGEVDLGNQNWSKSGDYFYTIIAGKAVGAYNITCSKYHTSTDSTLENGECIGNSNNNRVSIMDTSYTDAATFKAAMSGVMLHYELATPTVTPHEQPLNMTYRTEQGGTERVMVPTGENSAPPTLVTAQGDTAESLRDAALSAIAPVENGTASTNYAVGSYLVHGGQLCKVTTAIATGEAITIGTNVTATTVMAEVIALTQ